MLSTHCFAHLVVFSLKIQTAFDWKLSITRLLRLIHFPKSKISLPCTIRPGFFSSPADATKPSGDWDNRWSLAFWVWRKSTNSYFRMWLYKFVFPLVSTFSLMVIRQFFLNKKNEKVWKHQNNVHNIKYKSPCSFKDDFQSILCSLSTLMFINIINLTRWNVKQCYALQTTYPIFEAFQILFPTAALIFTAVNLFHQVIWERTRHKVSTASHP